MSNRSSRIFGFAMRQPPTSLVLFHCSFSDDGLSDHQTYSVDLSAFAALPHLYAVCALDDSDHPERMISGFLVKTSVGHDEGTFLDDMAAAFKALPQLDASLRGYTSLLSKPIDTQSQSPLTEDETLLVFKELWWGHVAMQRMAQ